MTHLNLEKLVLISKILVGYDGTECAQRALDFALDLVDKFSAELKVVNVLEIPVYSNPEEPMASAVNIAGISKDLRKVHQDLLNKAVEYAVKAKSNLNISAELREGNPPEQIVAAALEGSFDAVVVGHGRESRIRELFLGGTSERVAHLAPCAVIIVK